ncbi:hypothetical protein EYZ11_013339 [Aspergillus tanneri]|uniref:Uncharacterized protein n=1 Tax=Aspergillus tanneri TaxID=1220188 RepID=A0A4V3UMG1_9EURO|nr:hypothetical protein EYZ11_013339 [Aspergillus tanneri]
MALYSNKFYTTSRVPGIRARAFAAYEEE